MKNIITNAAEITVLPLIDTTYKTGGGPQSVGAMVGEFQKGQPFVVHEITRSMDPQDIFGKPFPKSAGTKREAFYHLEDAKRDCNWVNVVRVVADDARFPEISMKYYVDKGSWATETTYAVDDVVEITSGAKLICVTAHTTAVDAVEPDETDVTNWAVFEAETGPVDKGDWATATDYVANDIVEITDGTILICHTGHTSDAEPTGADTEWNLYLPAVQKDAHAYGTSLSVGSGYILQVYPIDGDPSTNRTFEIENVLTDKTSWSSDTSYDKNDMLTLSDGTVAVCKAAHTSGSTEPTASTLSPYWEALAPKHKRFKITFYDINDLGDQYEIEDYTFGILPDDLDDMGAPAFIETLLENSSDIFRANFNENMTWSEISALLGTYGEVSFVGGTNGGDPTSDNHVTAWDIFRNEQILSHLMFAAGNYDATVLANAIDIAKTNHTMFFFDVTPTVKADVAVTTLADWGLASRFAAAYYCPIYANDRIYGGKAIWGVSGEVAAACARGDANMTGETPGVHYAPAGEKRAKLKRTGIKQIYPEDIPNRETFYTARINPVIASDNGGAVIDDCLTIHYDENYSRFIWVNRILNYIDHRFVQMAAQQKFEPSGLTMRGLNRGMKEILDDLVTSEALHVPRNPEEDGTEPYIFTVTEEQIDLFLVTWDVCPTGCARRIAGQPRLIK